MFRVVRVEMETQEQELETEKKTLALCTACLKFWNTSKTKGRIYCSCGSNGINMDSEKTQRIQPMMCSKCGHIWIYKGTRGRQGRVNCPYCFRPSLKIHNMRRLDYELTNHYEITLTKIEFLFPKAGKRCRQFFNRDLFNGEKRIWYVE